MHHMSTSSGKTQKDVLVANFVFDFSFETVGSNYLASQHDPPKRENALWGVRNQELMDDGEAATVKPLNSDYRHVEG